MPYEYKGHTLPIHRDKDWHAYVDPFFRELIDKDEAINAAIVSLQASQSDTYIIETFDDQIDVIYSLRVSGDQWLVVKVTDGNGIYTVEHATPLDNSVTKNTAWITRESLIYKQLV